MIRLLYLLPIVGALLGGLALLVGVVSAKGSPQEAASAAIACALAIVPYVLVRSLEIMARSSREQEVNRLIAAIEALSAQGATSAPRESQLADR